MMGSGKSTVGRLVARRLGWGFVDLDEELSRETGRSVPALFAEGGEAGFRHMEARCLAAVLADEARGPAVVAAGGGVVGDPANRSLLRRAATVVWLRAEVATLEARVGDGAGRPLLAGADDAPGRRRALEALAAGRAPLYGEVADVTVDVDGLSAGEVAARVEAAVRRRG
ncbi:MAG: shikimate kinase [Acidobacteriota bacterium]|nr:shikimate kinase [Acidobacteriota bacterium]